MRLARKPQVVAPVACEVGENPLWHPDVGKVFFLDIPAGRVHSYDPSTGKCQAFSKGPVTGGMLLQADGRILLFQDGRVSILGLDGVQRVVARNLCPGNERFNDVIVDPEGRVFAGAMGGNGRLLRFDRDGSVHQVLDGIGVPNGMGFTLDLKGMYFTDSVMRQIYLFDYDRGTGELSNQRVFAEIPKDQGVPDGMAIDAEGFVWTAIWFGGRLKRYAPDGRWDSDVHLPVRQPSAVAFGGPDLSDLYVTSAAAHDPSPLEPPGFDTNSQRGGSLYALRVKGIRGRPLFRSRIDFGKRAEATG